MTPNQMRETNRLYESLPELSRMTVTELNDKTLPMSPAMFNAVLSEVLEDAPKDGRMYFEAAAFREALTKAGYWNERINSAVEQDKHIGAMLKHRKMNAKTMQERKAEARWFDKHHTLSME